MVSLYAGVDAVLLDMDGVLVEVADSYRAAIVGTAKEFGVTVTMKDIDAAKAKGGANNDWVLSRRLILGDEKAADATQTPTIDDVTAVFERLYQGEGGKPGLKSLEQPLVPRALLQQLLDRTSGRVCVVTGRPRADCAEAMARFGWDSLIPSESWVCMEDGPPKPDPFPINRALEILSKRGPAALLPSRVAMVGDTVDDVVAARKAGVRAIGVLTPAAAYEDSGKEGAAGGKQSDTRSILEGEGAEAVLLPGLAGLPELLESRPSSGGIFEGQGGGDADAVLRELLGGGVGAGAGPAASGAGASGAPPPPQPPAAALAGAGPTGDPERTLAALRVRAKAIAACPPSAPEWVARHGFVPREGSCTRHTKETSISAWVRLDGSGWSAVSTGLGFLDHMIGAMAKHGRMDVQLLCKGDLWIDDHHTAEDCSLALGEAMDRALGARKDITRWGSAMCPLDESLARAVVDVSSRPYAHVALDLQRDSVGAISCEMLSHSLESLLTAARLTAHVDVLRGSNDHHKAEASFKAVGVALRTAFKRDEGAGVPSTKGVLAQRGYADAESVWINAGCLWSPC